MLSEVTFLLACCLTDGKDASVLLRTLKEQLNITEDQAKVLYDKLHSAKLTPFETASAASEQVKQCQVRSPVASEAVMLTQILLRHIHSVELYTSLSSCAAVSHVQGDAAKTSYMAMPILSKVLQQMRPTDFQSYAEFRASCGSCLGSIGHMAERLTSLPPCLACKVDNNSAAVHAHMARVRGCLRRVLEPEERFFSAAEYAGAPPPVRSFLQACTHVHASHLRSLVTCIQLTKTPSNFRQVLGCPPHAWVAAAARSKTTQPGLCGTGPRRATL